MKPLRDSLNIITDLAEYPRVFVMWDLIMRSVARSVVNYHNWSWFCGSWEDSMGRDMWDSLEEDLKK